MPLVKALRIGLDVGLFLLVLYIFGENLNLMSMFIRTNTIGDCLPYYYAKFYK
jgi:hypothetical protein